MTRSLVPERLVEYLESHDRVTLQAAAAAAEEAARAAGARASEAARRASEAAAAQHQAAAMAARLAGAERQLEQARGCEAAAAAASEQGAELRRRVHCALSKCKPPRLASAARWGVRAEGAMQEGPFRLLLLCTRGLAPKHACARCTFERLSR